MPQKRKFEDEDGANLSASKTKKVRTEAYSTEFDADEMPRTFLSFKNAEWVAERAASKRTGPGRSWKSAKQLVTADSAQCMDMPLTFPTYARIQAEPSIKPVKKYCDITGLEGKYLDPRTRIRYAHSSLYPFLQELPNDMKLKYLELRKAYIAVK